MPNATRNNAKHVSWPRWSRRPRPRSKHPMNHDNLPAAAGGSTAHGPVAPVRRPDAGAGATGAAHPGGGGHAAQLHRVIYDTRRVYREGPLLHLRAPVQAARPASRCLSAKLSLKELQKSGATTRQQIQKLLEEAADHARVRGCTCPTPCTFYPSAPGRRRVTRQDGMAWRRCGTLWKTILIKDLAA